MKKIEKIAVYSAVEFGTRNMKFSERNLVLSDVANALGFKHWHDAENFSIFSVNRYGTKYGRPLLTRSIGV